MSEEARFAFSGPKDVFGVWEAAPTPEAVSFDADAPAPATWHIALPASFDAAQAILDTRTEAVHQGAADLTRARARLARVDVDVSAKTEPVSFAVPGVSAPPPEARLQAVLSAARAPDAVSFAAEAQAPDLAAERQSWQQHLAQVRRMLTHAAYVETEIGAAAVGRTAVSWDGDFRTTWQTGITPESMQLHRQSLHLALAWRLALVRLAVVVGVGAAGLAARASVSGVLALPAAWRFVQDVLEELRRLRAVQSEPI